MARIRLITQEEGAELLRQSRQRRGSDLEGIFLRCWTERHPDRLPLREFHFIQRRNWRFDFAWEREKVAVEIEGGSYVKGRHTQPAGFQGDCRKYNAAAIEGWCVLRFTSQDLRSRMGDVLYTVWRALDRGT